MTKMSLFLVYPVALIGQRQEFVYFCESFLLYFQSPAIIYTKRNNVHLCRTAALKQVKHEFVHKQVTLTV